jgi:capsular polysaccharide biosynthesis protein
MVPILATLGYGDSLYLLDEQPTVFETVAIATTPQAEHYCHPLPLRWLRQRLSERVRPGASMRLLISRRDASSRRIVNEAALATALAAYGFDLIVPSTLSPAAQLTLFASAELIVAPHGAALANLIACQTGTRVIEIAADFAPSICFAQISNLFGFDHALVEATAVGDDLLVNIGDVLSALAAFGVVATAE